MANPIHTGTCPHLDKLLGTASVLWAHTIHLCLPWTIPHSTNEVITHLMAQIGKYSRKIMAFFTFKFQFRRKSKTVNAQGLTNTKLRKPEKFMQMYRNLQTQHTIFEFCLREIFFPGHKVTMCSAVVFSIYGGVKLDGGRAVLMTFVAGTGLAYLSILFRRLGKFYDLSVDLQKSWKGRDRLVDRFILSSPPLRINVGNYYFVCRTTVANLGAIIIDSAINMLVTF